MNTQSTGEPQDSKFTTTGCKFATLSCSCADLFHSSNNDVLTDVCKTANMQHASLAALSVLPPHKLDLQDEYELAIKTELP